MKNIHIIPTDRPSRLSILNSGKLNFGSEIISSSNSKPQHIYITSDEEIKEGDWVITNNGLLAKVVTELIWHFINSKKIILTTDQDLIKDGVQSIDNEFLEWFVKNPSCEEVEIKKDEFYCKNDFINGKDAITYNYKIIIPKEELTISDEAKQRAKNYMSLKGALEPKQETLEEAAENYVRNESDDTLKLVSKYSFKDGAKWQAERMYSEEEVLKILLKQQSDYRSAVRNTSPLNWVLMLRNGLNNLKRNKQ